MHQQQQTYGSSLYESFKAIDVDSYRSILRFVEDHSRDISRLPVAEYFSLQFAYVAALYETGAYRRVIELSDELLELSIVHNLDVVDGEDAFRVLLFRRASSLFYLMRYDECLRVTDQLLRLHPGFAAAALLYEKALYQRPNPWISRGRALSVALFLLAAGLIAAEVLVVRHFFEAWAAGFGHARNACFIVGWVLLLGGDVGHRSWAWATVKRRRSRYAEARQRRR